MGYRGTAEVAWGVIVAGCRLAIGGPVMIATLIAALTLATVPAFAQTTPEACRILCAPALKIEPTVTIENPGRGPRIEVNGEVERTTPESVFELILALEVPTQLPRLGFTVEAIFVPFGDASVHPFTGVGAADLGRGRIRDNGIEFEAEFNITLIDEDQTAGWVSSHFDIVDKFSPGQNPRAGSTYTHKLNFEWDTAFHVFRRLPPEHWLRHVEAELSLDYVATGLPKAGDVLGEERFLDDANPWSLSFVLVFPLAPLVP